ncbi:hypothetical protein [uncultured Clostridium sp.]|uniref:flagellin N-terminal helical domain-containing protein n=1 Tax=uncultured Clostridium sp. TaxID=59620 RepID=UPI0025F6571D|nr:hypothetical protein [uncultured Clostridium sp.]
MKGLWVNFVMLFTNKILGESYEKKIIKSNKKNDPDGLCMMERIEAHICGIRVAIKNTEDGIEMLDKTDEGLCKVQKILHKMNELAVQCSSGTYSREQREKVDAEYQEYKEEINFIGSKTVYNGIPIFDPSKNPNIDNVENTLKLQIGAEVKEVVRIKVDPMNILAIGIADSAVSTQEKSRIAITKILNAIDLISARRVLVAGTKKKLNEIIEKQSVTLGNLNELKMKFSNNNTSTIKADKSFNFKSTYDENVIPLVTGKRAN